MSSFRVKSLWKIEQRQIDRPLLYLLPFFILGLVSGPELTACLSWLWRGAAILAFLVAGHTFWTRRIAFFHSGLLFLFIGAAATAQVLAPPRALNHVYQFINQEGLVFGGVVSEMPRVAEGRTRLVVDADVMVRPLSPPRAVYGRIHVTVADDRPAAMPGQRIRFAAKLREIAGFGNPGGFNYEQYMKAQGIWVSTFLSSSSPLVAVSRPGEKKPQGGLLSRIRLKAAEYIQRYTRHPARGVFKALLIGIRNDIDPAIRDTFRVFGLGHLLSISGLHVGLVALLSYFFLYRFMMLWPGLALRYNLKHICATGAALPVLLYAALAGGRPSTSRATVMVMIFLLSSLIDRKKDSMTALAAAAWFILILEPAAVFLASFQLSFAAAGIILLAYRRLQGLFGRLENFDRDPGPAGKPGHRLWQLTLIPLAATLGTAPIVAWHFNRLPVFSLPFNIVFTPLISLGVIPGGLIALVLAPVCPPVSQGLFFLLERLLWIFLLPLESLAGPFGIEYLVPRPSFIFMAGYYLLLGLVLHLKPGPHTLKTVLAAFGIWAALLAAPSIHQSIRGPRLEVTVLDVGQGNAAHISFPDHRQMIIDGGGFPGSGFDPGQGLIEPYLAANGITRLDMTVLSHPHADHVIGLPYLVETFDPAELWTNHAPGRHPAYQSLKKIAVEKNMRHPSLKALHQPRSFGSATVEILWPPADYQSRHSTRDILENQNDYSLVVKVCFGRTAFLFPGDLEAEGISGITRQFGDRLKADVLVAPHHGDGESMTVDLLEAVQPKFVVFSAGRFNRFHLPSEQAVRRVENIGARVFRTDIHGAVSFISDGYHLNFKTVKKEPRMMAE